MAKLTSEEIPAYETEGCVVPSWRVPEDRVAALAAATEEVIAANPDTRPEQLPNVHVTNGAGTHPKGHPAFLDVALDEDLPDLASCVLGEDLGDVGLPDLLQAGGGRHGGADAPGRPVLAHRAARDVHDLRIAIDDSDRGTGASRSSRAPIAIGRTSRTVPGPTRTWC